MPSFRSDRSLVTASTKASRRRLRPTVERLEDRCSPSTIIDLGTLSTGYNSYGFDINDSGVIVGNSYTALFSHEHAYSDQNGRMTDIGTLGGDFSEAVGINQWNYIVGDSTTSGGDTHAFCYYEGTMHDMGTLGGSTSHARAINSQGLLVGDATTSVGNEHAFVKYYGGTMVDLGTLGGPISWANAINDPPAGQDGPVEVVGAAFTASYQQHAFIWDNGSGTMTDLGTFGGFLSEAFAINNSSQVVGDAMNAAYQIHAFLWQNGTMSDLGTLGGGNSHAYGINNLGQVVGAADTSFGITHAFVYSGGTMTDLNKFLPANSGWLVLTRANSINDHGQIVGTGITTSGFTHAFELNLNS